MALRLKGRTALVTGAGRGIGRAIAERLAREGAFVAVVTRGADSGHAAVAAIRAAGGRAELFAGDVGDRDQVRTLVATAVAALGGLDIVVHNAALAVPAPIGDITDAMLDRAVDLNLKALIWLTQAALPALKESAAARILCVSSITGNRIANAGFAVYGATKAGLNGFIRQAAAELGAHGIRVNGVEPGVTLTDAVADYLGAQASAVAAGLPLGQVTHPADIAAAIAFLASDDAAQITGQTIVVDGGQSLGASALGADKV